MKKKIQEYIKMWENRCYSDGIPDEAPHELEVKCWAPSWRRLCRVILRNDYWCKGLGQTQPKSEAYQKFKSIKEKRKMASMLTGGDNE